MSRRVYDPRTAYILEVDQWYRFYDRCHRDMYTWRNSAPALLGPWVLDEAQELVRFFLDVLWEEKLRVWDSCAVEGEEDGPT